MASTNKRRKACCWNASVERSKAALAAASQITQAEAKKFFIESTRLLKWETSGLLWWNVIDGWPQFSDAIVDHYYSVLEAAGDRIEVIEETLTFLRPIKKAWLCNMNEEAIGELPAVGNAVDVTLDPFKIVTVMLEF